MKKLLDKLSANEREIAVLMAKNGLSNLEIFKRIQTRRPIELSEIIRIRNLVGQEKLRGPVVEVDAPAKAVAENNSVILCISDMHMPWHHPDTVEFLTAVKKKHNPTRVVSVGDEIDAHSLSFHDSDPDLLSAGDELTLSIEALQPIYKLFPNVDVLESNHGSMIYRKGKHHGIARKYLKGYNEVLEAPPGWRWHDNLRITLPNGQLIYFTHGVKKSGISLAKSLGCNVVQGHFHTEFNINYASSPTQLYWSMQVGCSIDDKSLAFEYNKTTEIRPIIGHGLIKDGLPQLLPMILNSKGRWTGYVP